MSEHLLQDRLKKIRLVFEDEFLLVVDKPAGLAVHGGAETKGRDLLAVLRSAYAKPPSLVLAHRLDRGTSGVLLLAKSSEMAAALQGLWPMAQKRYLAVVAGRLEQSQRIETPLSTKDGRMQSARSEVLPLSVAGDATLIQVDITTGRHHQIRRHLASIGHPVLMDDRHGDFAANKAWRQAIRTRGASSPKHIALHAHRLTVIHPQSGENRTFEAPMPPVWRDWIS
ncbi:MAG: RluA family pseudouridine synthase [Pseudomonadota bacterium]